MRKSVSRAAVILAKATAASTLYFLSVTVGTHAGSYVTVFDIEDQHLDKVVAAVGGVLSSGIKSTMTDQSIPAILQQIQKNIDAISTLRQTVTTARVTTEETEHVATVLTEIADSFQKIADMAPDVFSRREIQTQKLNQIGQDINTCIADAKREIDTFVADSNEFSQKLKVANVSPSDTAIINSHIRANNVGIASSASALRACQAYSQHFSNSMKIVSGQSEQLKVFFSILRDNARAYGYAAKSVRIVSSLRVALADIDKSVRDRDIDNVEANISHGLQDLLQIIDQVNSTTTASST